MFFRPLMIACAGLWFSALAIAADQHLADVIASDNPGQKNPLFLSLDDEGDVLGLRYQSYNDKRKKEESKFISISALQKNGVDGKPTRVALNSRDTLLGKIDVIRLRRDRGSFDSKSGGDLVLEYLYRIPQDYREVRLSLVREDKRWFLRDEDKQDLNQILVKVGTLGIGSVEFELASMVNRAVTPIASDCRAPEFQGSLTAPSKSIARRGGSATGFRPGAGRAI